MSGELTYRFPAEKNALLKAGRGVGFDDVIYCIENGYVLDIIKGKAKKYSHQQMYIVEINNYAFVVPFVLNKGDMFLKTIYPSRVMTAKYLVSRGGGMKKNKIIKPSQEIDDDSYDLLMAIENGEEFEQIPDYKEVVEYSKKAAKNYFKKDARVSFRISPTDLDNVKRMAASEGLPYQTYLTSMIHKLTTGQLFVKN